MGVQGLWQILEPTGQPVNLDSLEGKRLAVDISLWLHQAAHGFSAHGGDTKSPHLVLLINRIAKLVFFKIRPVFVFDGDKIPVFKKHVLRDRQLRRYIDEITISKQQKRALKEAAETGQALGPIQLGIEDDLFALPDEAPKKISPKKPVTTETDDFLAGYHDLVSRDDRIAFLADVKQKMKKNKLNDHDIPEDPNDFVKFQQQRVLQRVKVNSEIDALRNEKIQQSSKLKNQDLKAVVIDAHSRGHLLTYEKSEKNETEKVIEKPRIGNWNEFVKQVRQQFKDKPEREKNSEIRTIRESGRSSSAEGLEESDQGTDEIQKRKAGSDEDIEEGDKRVKEIQKERDSWSDDDLGETMHMISSEKPSSSKVDREFLDVGLSKSNAIENFMEKLNKKKAHSPSLITIESSDDSDMEVVPLDTVDSEINETYSQQHEVIQIDDSQDGNELNFIEKDKEDLVEQPREDETKVYAECQQLLDLLGLPYIVAPGEAEAQCAELEHLGLVEGIVTDDSDIWLFGGKRIYKNMFNKNRNVHFFDADIIEKELGLAKLDFIVLTMLAGGDYTRGLDNVGVVTALELIAEFSEKRDNTEDDAFNILQSIKNWLISKSEFEHTHKSPKIFSESAARNKLRKKIEKSNDRDILESFPNRSVFEAYCKPIVNSKDETFKWSQVNFTEFELFLWNSVGWSLKEFHDKTHNSFKNWDKFISSNIQTYQTRITGFSKNLNILENIQFNQTKRVTTALKKLSKSRKTKTFDKVRKLSSRKYLRSDDFSDDDDSGFGPPKKMLKKDVRVPGELEKSQKPTSEKYIYDDFSDDNDEGFGISTVVFKQNDTSGDQEVFEGIEKEIQKSTPKKKALYDEFSEEEESGTSTKRISKEKHGTSKSTGKRRTKTSSGAYIYDDISDSEDFGTSPKILKQSRKMRNPRIPKANKEKDTVHNLVSKDEDSATSSKRSSKQNRKIKNLEILKPSQLDLSEESDEDV